VLLLFVLKYYSYIASLHDQKMWLLSRGGLYPANQSNLSCIQRALIGWKKAGPLKKPLLFYSCKQANRYVVNLNCNGVWPFSKSKLELESNLSKILPGNCKFNVFFPKLNLTKLKTRPATKGGQGAKDSPWQQSCPPEAF